MKEHIASFCSTLCVTHQIFMLFRGTFKSTLTGKRATSHPEEKSDHTYSNKFVTCERSHHPVDRVFARASRPLLSNYLHRDTAVPLLESFCDQHHLPTRTKREIIPRCSDRCGGEEERGCDRKEDVCK